MSIIQRKILNRNEDINIKFSLSSNDDQTGHQEEIDSFTQIQTSSSINEPTDAEVRRFSFNGPTDTVLEYSFYSKIIAQYSNSFNYAGFSNSDVEKQRNNFLNSFFRLDLYDTFISNQQTRLFSNYLTKLINGRFNNPIISSYILNNENQFYYLNVPINIFNDTTDDTIDLYGLFTFYNAKSGQTSIFYNWDNRNLTSPQKLYFRIRLNLLNKTWEILTSSITSPTGTPRAFIFELKDSTEYIEKYNNTLDNFNNLNQNYPTGSTFNFETGKYSV